MSDATGTKFVYQAIDEVTKNHQDDDSTYGGNMYATDGNMCPVYTFELYLEVLNCGNNYLFQRARSGYFVRGQAMFDNVRKGATVLGDMMATISTDAELSKRYTNHCIRATCVSLLDENYDPTQIMGVSMHKSLSSILSYRGRVKKSKKRDMSRSLTAACTPSKAKKAKGDDGKSMPSSAVLDVAGVPSTDDTCVVSPSNNLDMIDDELDQVLQSIDMQQFSQSQTTVMSAPVFNMYGATSVVVHNHYYGH